MLLSLKGIGPGFAGALWSEALFRTFRNRRQVAAYAGLAPTPWKSGTINHEQGVSKAGNPRLRAIAARQVERVGGGKPIRVDVRVLRSREVRDQFVAQPGAASGPATVSVSVRLGKLCHHSVMGSGGLAPT